MFIGSEKLYFIPDLKADEMIVRKGRVLAEEFDNTDFTVKVRFLDGNAVQKFAVADTEEELQDAFDRFQIYRRKYWDCFDRIQPIENELKALYNQLYSEYMDVEFGQHIADRHNPEKVLAEMKEEEDAVQEEKEVELRRIK